jgi:glycosyltransferase involved in cell wall biosynthesis
MEQRDLLAYFYAAAVHAQVSWYETPGLASMEAACGGCAIVSTDRGSTREYFGDLVHYCDPWSQESIEAVLRAALAGPPDPALRETILARYTWDLAARDTIEAYRQVLVR